MLTLPFLHKNGKAVAVADISSDSVGACIALVNDGDPATIICAERMFLTFDDRPKEQSYSSILSLLEESATKIVRIYSKFSSTSGSMPVSAVHAIIHTPLVSSKTFVEKASFNGEKRITDNIIGDLAKSAIASLAEKKELDKANVFEASVVSIALNGYRTGKPVGKHASSVSVASLLSECEPKLRTGITEALRKGFGIHNPVLHSDIRALLLGAHKNHYSTNRYFVIDMSGNSTNCVVIHNDTESEHIIVPEGFRTILKRIAGKGLAEETLSLMRMVSRDACDTQACEQLNVSLAQAEQELMKIFGERFSKLISERRLPNDLVLIVAPDFAPWMSNFFSRIEFGQFTVTTGQFNVRVLTPEDMHESVSGNLGPKTDTWFSLGTALARSKMQST
jgi:hypothetical protein